MIRPALPLTLTIILLLLPGCAESDTSVITANARGGGDPDVRERVERVLDANMTRILAYADSIESALRPEPLLRPGHINAFRRYRNPDQLRVARQLGIPQPVSREAMDRHLADGRLVNLDVDNPYWVVRELHHSVALAIPDVEILLNEIGERFHAELARRGLPPLRLEVTSVLRTARDQAELRLINPDAARGESTHQFGTTIDVAYSSFRAPQTPVLDLDVGEAPWLEPYLRRMEALAAETGAARMSRELQAILGHVLLAMQNEGKVMVTMETLNPVYHMTVARRLG
jgi:hypothetical protein